MPKLIVYMSKHGTTRKVAQALEAEMGGDTQVVDLQHDAPPDLDAYEIVVVGGSIHAGEIQPKVKRYCLENEEKLLAKRLGLFICFMDQNRGVEEFVNAFPEALRLHATAIGLMGGEFLFDQMNFFERVIVRHVAGVKQDQHLIDDMAIHDFAQQLCN